MPPILLVVFHCLLYRERISSWGAAGLFQFPLLREGRRGKSCTTSSFLRFQFTPLREGRLYKIWFIVNGINFNSRPSARGDAVSSCVFSILLISIHAPPRGATSCGGVRRACRADFNSRPSARGDGSGRRIHRLPCHFNSRPSARGDPCRVAASCAN